jgi:cbb3-type cytochrome oxidase subunit 3
MIQNVLRHMGGIDVYGVVSILLFFAVFIGVVWWAARLKPSQLDAMARLPLDPEPEEAESRESSHE